MADNHMRGKKSRENGKTFEGMIDRACEFYRLTGVAAIKKTPEPMRVIKNIGKGQFICCFGGKAEPDYKGVLANGRAIIFDAKHSEDDRIQYSWLSEQQLDDLDTYQKMGAVAFVLVSLRFKDFYAVPFAVWRNMQQLFGHKHIKQSELEPYRVRADRFIEFITSEVLKNER